MFKLQKFYRPSFENNKTFVIIWFASLTSRAENEALCVCVLAFLGLDVP